MRIRTRRLKHLMKFRELIYSITAFLLGIDASIITDQISSHWVRLLPLVAAVTLIFGVLALLSILTEPPKPVRVDIDSPITIRDEVEAKRYARQGFVGFVPYFTPRPKTVTYDLSPEERKRAVENLDFGKLNIENSNFQPVTHAILQHAERTRHCWLIATTSDQGTGSLDFVNLLVEYLRQQKNLDCEFHAGREYTVRLDADAEVLKKTYDLVIKKIFKEASDLGIPPDEMVVDITPGLRSMALGATLACLDAEHDIEFVGTKYDQTGRPVGPLHPIIYGFEAIP